MLPPVVERELRVALLRRKARKEWMHSAWIAGGMCFFFLVVLDIASSRYTGRTLFLLLFAGAAAITLSRGFGLTADLFSEERRNGTLGLLVLTGMRPLEIFANKLLGATLMVAYGLLGALPFFSVPFLAGGVPVNQFICALAFLANALVFSVAIGLLGSVLHRDGGQAQVTSIILAGVLCLAGPVVYWIRNAAPSMPTPSANWLASSPADALVLVFGKFTGSAPHSFWVSSTWTLIYSLTALLLAAIILQRTWREEPDNSREHGWRAWLQKWARGGDHGQRRLRARYISHQPLYWLGLRDRLPVAAANAYLAFVVVLWFCGWHLWGLRWLRPGTAFLSSTIMHLGLNWILAYAAGKSLAEERLSGGFELLLTTPLSSRAIVHGLSQALILRFRSVVLLACGLDWLFCAGTFSSPPASLGLALLYLLVWAGVMFYWFATHLETAAFSMWISTWTGRAGYAAIHAMRTPLVYVFWIGVFFGGVAGVAGGGPMNWFLPLLIFVVAGLSSLDRRRTLREKLMNELKWIAAAAIPARGDKRFKSWNPQAIYPPGRWGELDLQLLMSRKPPRRRALTPVRPPR